MDQFDAGEKIQLGINFDKIHFFDKETELRVPTMDEVQMNRNEEKDSLTA